MNSYRKTAIIVGVLFLAGYVGVFVGGAISGPILKAPDYLSNIYPNKTQVIIGMLVEVLLNDVPVVGIGVMLFPILKKYSESIALWYVGMRVIEAVTLIVGTISALSLITLSQEYIAAGAPDASHFQALGALTLAERFWAVQMLIIFFGLGALIFYYLLYQSKLIPRFISVWGLIGVPLTFTGVLLVMFGFNLELILFLPLGVNEIFLGVWLIVKGFNSSAIASLSAKTDINEIK